MSRYHSPVNAIHGYRGSVSAIDWPVPAVETTPDEGCVQAFPSESTPTPMAPEAADTADAA